MEGDLDRPHGEPHKTRASQYALCLRGTMAGSPIDTSEDMEVGIMLPFAAGGAPKGGDPGNISQGAMEAFTDVIMGTTLMRELRTISWDGLNPIELYVTGHSLGGALVTTVSLHLANGHLRKEQIHPYTFTAPTAGMPPSPPGSIRSSRRPCVTTTGTTSSRTPGQP
jgi:hypothetical protein